MATRNPSKILSLAETKIAADASKANLKALKDAHKDAQGQLKVHEKNGKVLAKTHAAELAALAKQHGVARKEHGKAYDAAGLVAKKHEAALAKATPEKPTTDIKPGSAGA